MLTGRSGNKGVNGISAGGLSKRLSGFQRVLHFGDQRERVFFFRERKNGYCLKQRINRFFFSGKIWDRK